MKDAFLEKVFNEYTSKDLSQHCFVFPTRRAAYVFRQKFLKNNGKTTWLPEILAIRDLIERLSPYPIADDLVLLLLLHSVVDEYEKDIPLDKFFPWGKILLNDFNELDQNLVNAEALYHQSIEEREIDVQFSLSEEELQDVAGFWKLFSKKPLSSLQQDFLASWKSLPAIYKKFKEVLLKKHLSYEGMTYRIIVEQLKEGKLFLPWSKFVFSGFYALSVAERSILEELSIQKKADLYWDVDNYYYKNPLHEAGLYLRRNNFLKNEFSWQHDFFKEIPKSIYITGAPLQTAQVKWISNILKDKLADPSFDPVNSVIVLPDEAMLVPLLNSLPEELKGLNITMGYPVKHTRAGNIVKSFLELHKNVKSTSSGSYFVRQHAENLLSLIDNALINEGVFSKAFHQSGQLYIAADLLSSQSTAISFVFEPLTDFATLEIVLNKLIKFYTDQLKGGNNLEITVADYINLSFKELFATLRQHAAKLTIKMMLQILEEGMLTVKIPFTSEPIKGIQLMGFLETRTLDFDHVFILSVNENFLPAVAGGKTYIPYSIRKSFKLPLRNEQDAVYAYHFYRLLQRAKVVHLIYNTEAKSVSGGEMSRYLLQIAFELNEAKGFPVKLFFNLVNTEAIMQSENTISVKKDDVVLTRLKELYIKSENVKGFSATAIADYVACPLRFYFKNVSRIRKPDEEDREISGKVFGNIFHKAISNLYKGKKEIDNAQFVLVKKQIDEVLDQAVLTVYKKTVTTGNDLLLKGVLLDLLKKVVDLDAQESPLEIVGLEQVYSGSLSLDNTVDIAISGYIDRVDKVKGVFRIIDYKTGNDIINNQLDIDTLFTNPNKKVTLQLLFYSLLFKSNFPGQPIKAGMYKLRNVNTGIQWINGGNVLTDELLESFKSALLKLIGDIFNSNIDFSQTDDLKQCEYCDFKKICNRL